MEGKSIEEFHCTKILFVRLFSFLPNDFCLFRFRDARPKHLRCEIEIPGNYRPQAVPSAPPQSPKRTLKISVSKDGFDYRNGSKS
jgi:hypothetical protein